MTRFRRLHQHHGLTLVLTTMLLGVICAGCALQQAFKTPDRDPIHHLSFHAFASDRMVGSMSQIVSDADGGRQFRIRRFPIVSSKQITRASCEETSSGTGARVPVVRLYLDRHGQICWMQACAQTPGDRVAVLVDGFFACATTLPSSGVRTGVIELIGPWSAEEAQAIAQNAKTNYRKLNDIF